MATKKNNIKKVTGITKNQFTYKGKLYIYGEEFIGTKKECDSLISKNLIK
jgi:hypothetical protein